MMTSLALAYMVTRSAATTQESVLERLAGEESAVPVVPATPTPLEVPAPTQTQAPVPAPAPATSPGAPAPR